MMQSRNSVRPTYLAAYQSSLLPRNYLRSPHPCTSSDIARRSPQPANRRECNSNASVVSRRAILRQLLVASVAIPKVTFPALASTSHYDKYDQYAETYEKLDGTTGLADILGFSELRRRLLSQAKGDVLELGIGTGLNLPLYDFREVSSITGVDFSAEMLSFASRRAMEITNSKPEIRLVEGRAEKLQLPDKSFDTVLDTFSLCVFPEPLKALKEMRRLVKDASTARVLLLEHSRSSNPVLATYQDVTAEPTAAMSKGCYPNQDVIAMVRSTGFKILKQERHLAGTVVFLELGV